MTNALSQLKQHLDEVILAETDAGKMKSLLIIANALDRLDDKPLLTFTDQYELFELAVTDIEYLEMMGA